MPENPSRGRALISVSDKSGIVEFARGLVDAGFEIYSTGGTKNVLSDSEVEVHSITELTNFPEILEGRVKTLHPGIHGGILAKRDKAEHLSDLSEHHISLIDLVVVNLYPFSSTVAKAETTLDIALEDIDIGGVALLRAAAKNFQNVLVVVSPDDYKEVITALAAPPQEGIADNDFRQKLAAKAFQHTASYDTYIAQYLRTKTEHFPERMTVALEKVQDLRYGENPHQIAAFYGWRSSGDQKFTSIATAKQLQGKELSYNNILDADAALAIVRDFSAPTVTVVKHSNPCGLASNSNLQVAYELALAGDAISAYGGIIGVNRTITAELATSISSSFFEVVVAPSFTPEALEVFKKRKNLRLLETGDLSVGSDQIVMNLELRPVLGGFLAQTRDVLAERDIPMQVMTGREPTLEEITNLQFAWRAVKHVKSNAIVLAKNHSIVGMGAGQPSRVDSVKIALSKAGSRASGCVLASDAYFPKVDGVETAVNGGVTAIIQPGGSISDQDVIEVAQKHNITMVFTGRRHFKH
ncbi:MAG: bifunctional phosphoribosylaminoimidazolecarboxamide formyltransferase/IMP cyclohydrolase [Chloroflexi bacterium]|uniref:Bifunctional purine biosynthesis protein PurH n=1 Tax=Candidatus Chlorohelix allophototropha TaxID=3003348 RepID=A0A8T7M835_9CHLR|nr:bifunctional phosphoribosylaminoimidazolecarboxamide formyltransferase/IMP cyclohydrolase [Chloroflexota bacterium]WJW68239.1 bifunctional phosphoribosylaminoimidazolecarboxamide formyltransferase/IMP cyclohydrolase [Chloroflexota bacterium L227-S17]